MIFGIQLPRESTIPTMLALNMSNITRMVLRKTRWKSCFHKSDKGANQILLYTTKLGLLRSFNFNKNGSFLNAILLTRQCRNAILLFEAAALPCSLKGFFYSSPHFHRFALDEWVFCKRGALSKCFHEVTKMKGLLL